MRHAAPGLTPGLRIPMHIVAENRAFLGRVRNSEHRIPARNALQSEKCADFFRGSVPWVPPGAAAGSACHSCCEAAAGSITPGVAAYERTGHRRPPGPHRDPASAARKLPEYSPNTSRRPPAGHHPNTSRILPDGRPKTHANTSRIPREYFPGTFRVTSGLYAIPLVANYSRSIRAVFGRLFAQVFAWVFGCVFGRSWGVFERYSRVPGRYSGRVRWVFGRPSCLACGASVGARRAGIRCRFRPRRSSTTARLAQHHGAMPGASDGTSARRHRKKYSRLMLGRLFPPQCSL